MTTIPEDLKTTSLRTPNISAVVVCPDQESILTAVKEAQDMNIINPTLVGDINLIEQKEPVFQFKNELKNYSKSDIIKDYSKIIIKPTQEEFVKHKKFIDKEFKKNFY